MRLASLTIAMLAMLACRGSTAPVALPTVHATVARVEVPVGQAIIVDVSLTNDTADPIEVMNPMTFLEVRDAAGTVVAFGRFCITDLMARAPLRVTPGTTIRDRTSWGDELNSPSHEPGTYQVRAVVHLVRSAGIAYSEPVTAVVTSP